MKAYAIFPTVELEREDTRSVTCIDLVTGLVVQALRAGGDTFQYAVEWRDPGSTPDCGIFHAERAEAHIHNLRNEQALTARVRAAVDPFNSAALTIRSIATCRAVTFGYDGQAFLSLRHEDEAPISPDTTLAVVRERPEYLTETDYFDGFVTGHHATVIEES